jgi:hypothetical protein
MKEVSRLVLINAVVLSSHTRRKVAKSDRISRKVTFMDSSSLAVSKVTGRGGSRHRSALPSKFYAAGGEAGAALLQPIRNRGRYESKEVA